VQAVRPRRGSDGLTVVWCEFHRIANAATPTTTNPATTAARFKTVITNYTQRSWVATLHGVDATLRALLYQETPFTRHLAVPANGNTSDCPAGVSEEQAAANPTWYAKTSGGALITNQIIQAPDNLLDVGLAAMRTAWSLNTRTRALAGSPAAQDFQGVFADDVNYDLASSTSAYPAAYPTNAAWWTAQQGMFQAVYSDFSGAGLHLVPNMAQWSNWDYYLSMDGILPYTDGGNLEFFVTFGNGASSGWFYNCLALADATIAAGKRFYATSHGTAANAIYGLATLMLCAHATNQSLQSFTWAGLQDYANEYWDATFDLNIGQPVGARFEVGPGASGFRGLQRQFTAGTAMVNPAYNTDGTAHTGNVTFSLPAGRTGTGSGFTNASTVTLAPGAGALLVLDPVSSPVIFGGTGPAQDRLALSVTLNDGRIVRWGGDEPDVDRIPQDLDFSTAIPGGYKDLTTSVLRAVSGGDERLFNRTRAYGPGNRTAWDGRLQQFPREDLMVNPAAVGFAAHLQDDTSFREIYVDPRMSKWTPGSLRRRIALMTAGYGVGDDPQVISDPTNNQPALQLSLTGAWGLKALSEAWYSGGGIPLGALYYAWKIGTTVGSGDANWTWQAVLSDTDDHVAGQFDTSANLRAAGPGTGTLTATTSSRLYLTVQQSYAIAAGTDQQIYPVWWTALAVYGTHGLTKQGTASATDWQGFYADDLIADIVSRAAPLLDVTRGPGGVETNANFVVPEAIFDSPTTGQDAVMDVNKYFLWEWGVYDDLKFFWREPDPARLLWRGRLDRGTKVSLEGEAADTRFNGVIVRYTDPIGVQKIAGPTASYWQGGIARCDVTNDALVDTNAANPVNQAGIPRRWGVLDVGPTTTDAGAVQLGYVWLQEHALPQRRGSITLADTVYHPTEGYVPTWRVRAGDGILIDDLADDEPRRIIETRYTRRDDSNVLTVGNSDFKIDSILERIGVQLSGLVGS
jgi:hypothetical protein